MKKYSLTQFMTLKHFNAQTKPKIASYRCKHQSESSRLPALVSSIRSITHSTTGQLQVNMTFYD